MQDFLKSPSITSISFYYLDKLISPPQILEEGVSLHFLVLKELQVHNTGRE